jgi:tRNA pseudouridine38-40 synthase
MRLALGLEYDGRDYAGWQHQGHSRAVQTVVETALARVADHPVHITAAGRTDSGVHATLQVIHFDTEVARSPRGWMLGTNSNLPPDVAVQWVQPVAESFSARRSALARTYRYLIDNRLPRPALGHGRATWERRPLDAARMHAAAQALLGEHDFSAFRALSCQARSATRQVSVARVWREGDLVQFEIRANAFLHHMVRNLAGSLLDIGAGEQPEGWLAELLAERDRSVAGATARPDGLYLIDVEYPAEFGLPRGRPPLLLV